MKERAISMEKSIRTERTATAEKKPIDSERAVGHLLVLDSLRGAMALWVVFAHIGEFAAYRLENSPAIFHPIFRPQIAVEVFMLLSGFVIGRLIVEKREPYPKYIVRRFLRLWPGFAVICGLSIFTTLLIPGVLGWQIAEANQDEAISYASTSHYFWAHLAAAIPMAQGLMPETLLPNGALSFLPPAWSISLEFQFYLVAPLLVMGIIRGRLALGAVLCLSAASFTVLHRYYPFDSILPAKLGFFVAGILSYRFYRFYPLLDGRPELPWLLTLGGLALLPSSPAWGIWLLAMALILSSEETPILGKLKTLAGQGIFTHLGAISFSVYLVHYPLLRIAKSLVLQNNPHIGREQMALTLIVTILPTTLILAHLLYSYIELPGIALGKRARKLPKSK